MTPTQAAPRPDCRSVYRCCSTEVCSQSVPTTTGLGYSSWTVIWMSRTLLKALGVDGRLSHHHTPLHCTLHPPVTSSSPSTVPSCTRCYHPTFHPINQRSRVHYSACTAMQPLTSDDPTPLNPRSSPSLPLLLPLHPSSHPQLHPSPYSDPHLRPGLLPPLPPLPPAVLPPLHPHLPATRPAPHPPLPARSSPSPPPSHFCPPSSPPSPP